MAGYSTTLLAKKLGIKPGFRVKTSRAPDYYEELLAPIPEGVDISARFRKPVDLWHLFVTSRSELLPGLKRALREIPNNGMIWVSWPKKASGVVSDVTGNAIREAAFPLGLVDIKVCAVDDTWSGLKLVIRKNLR